MRKIFKILIIIAIVLVSLFFVGLILFMVILSSIGSDDTPPLCIESFPNMTFNSEVECQKYQLQEIQKAVEIRQQFDLNK